MLSCRSSDALSSVSETTGLKTLSELFSHSPHTSFPVVDANNRMVGMILGHELRAVAGRGELDPLIIASDLAHPPVTVTPDQDLFDAIRLMAQRQLDELIVVDPHDKQQALAMLRRNDIINAYHDALVSNGGQ